MLMDFCILVLGMVVVYDTFVESMDSGVEKEEIQDEHRGRSTGKKLKGTKLANLEKQNRIIHGDVAELGQFKYTVQIDNPKSICGGAIYDKDTVVSAAHCFRRHNDTELAGYSIIAGNPKQEKNKGQKNKIKKVYVHRFFEKNFTLSNDIAVVKLEKSFKFDNDVGPIPLASSENDTWLKQDAVISGWGYTKGKEELKAEWSSKISSELLFAPVIIAKCVTKRINTICLTGEKLFVHGAFNYTAGICQGDSGGPLVCLDKNKKAFLCGIISAGAGCGRPDSPGICTMVSYFHDWILEMANKEIKGPKYELS